MAWGRSSPRCISGSRERMAAQAAGKRLFDPHDEVRSLAEHLADDLKGVRFARRVIAGFERLHSPSPIKRESAARARRASNSPTASWISASVRRASASASSSDVPSPALKRASAWA